MKKHKVKIPEGYEVDRSFSNHTASGAISTTVIFKPTFKPIEKQLRKSWDDFMRYYRITSNTEPLQIPTPLKHTEALYALIKLIQLRDVYNDGWVPDWKDVNDKYTIGSINDELHCTSYTGANKILAFKTPELRGEFLKNFRHLIETAKPLL